MDKIIHNKFYKARIKIYNKSQMQINSKFKKVITYKLIMIIKYFYKVINNNK